MRRVRRAIPAALLAFSILTLSGCGLGRLAQGLASGVVSAADTALGVPGELVRGAGSLAKDLADGAVNNAESLLYSGANKRPAMTTRRTHLYRK